MPEELPSDLPVPAPIAAGGQWLSVRTLAPGRGRRLLLLHGGPGLDHHLVLPLGLALAGRFEVLLPDLPGHGRSHDDSRGLPDLSRLVESTARWLIGLDGRVDVLVGHSLGAFVARELLRLGYARPAAAVLIAPPAASADAPRPAGQGLAGVRTTSTGRSHGAAQRALRAELLEFVGSDADRRPSPMFAASIARALIRAPRRYGELHAQLRRVLSKPPVPFEPPCPVLVVGGARDPIAPPSSCAETAAATGGARHVTLDGAGHFPFVDDAAPLARTIAEFVVD